MHVNMALVLKFMANYLFNPADVPAGAARARDAADDEFLFRQGPARGPRQDPVPRLARAPTTPFADVPNVARFTRAGRGASATLLAHARRRARSSSATSTSCSTLGELFTLVVYGQLILEQAALTGLDADTLDQIFDVLVRDFSGLRRRSCTARRRRPTAQQAWALDAGPQARSADAERFDARLGAGAGARGRVRDAAVDD